MYSWYIHMNFVHYLSLSRTHISTRRVRGSLMHQNIVEGHQVKSTPSPQLSHRSRKANLTMTWFWGRGDWRICPFSLLELSFHVVFEGFLMFLSMSSMLGIAQHVLLYTSCQAIDNTTCSLLSCLVFDVDHDRHVSNITFNVSLTFSSHKYLHDAKLWSWFLQFHLLIHLLLFFWHSLIRLLRASSFTTH